MIRMRIQITEEQAGRLRAMSAVLRVPVAELIRLSIDSFSRTEAGVDRKMILARAKSAAGRFSSSHSGVSAEHDEHLAEAFGSQ
jgi:hypothetical protein